MKSNEQFKYKFDEQQGIFVRESDISVNWLLNGVLTTEDLQITKVSNEEIQKFLYLLDNSDLRMLDGKHALVWLKDKLKEYHEMSKAKDGETWFKICERYRYIIEQIDLTLIKSKDMKEKMEIKKEEAIIKPFKTPNNMSASFEEL